MPAPLTLDDVDRKMFRVLSRLRGDHRAEALRLINSTSPPSVQNIPESFYQRIEDEEAAALILLLSSTYRRAQTAFQDALRISVNPDKMQQDADAYAKRRAGQLSGRITTNTRKLLTDRDITRQLDGSYELPYDNDDLDKAFGPARVKTLASNEATLANTNAEDNFANAFAGQNNLVVTRFWHTNPACRHCRYCPELEGTPEIVWAQFSPGVSWFNARGGPPAHPGCCCFLEYVFHKPGDEPRPVRGGDNPSRSPGGAPRVKFI